MTCSSSLLCAFKSDNNITVKCHSSDGIFPQVLSCLEFLFRHFLMAAVMQLIKNKENEKKRKEKYMIRK